MTKTTARPVTVAAAVQTLAWTLAFPGAGQWGAKAGTVVGLRENAPWAALRRLIRPLGRTLAGAGCHGQINLARQPQEISDLFRASFLSRPRPERTETGQEAGGLSCS